MRSVRKVGFKEVRIVSEATYDVNVFEELKGKITSVHEAHKK